MIKTTIVLFICLMAVWLARRRSASIRHFLLSFFLIGLLLLPLLSTVRFGWETRLLPAQARVAGERRMRGSFLLGRIDTLRPAGFAPNSGGLRAAAESGLVGGKAAPATLTWRAPAAGRFASMILPFLWSAGLAFLLLKLSLGIVGACRLTREGIDVTDPGWRRLLARFLATIRITRAIRLKSHDGIDVPITWGFFKPVVLLPRRHKQWAEDQRSSALLHELCHIKRADFLILFLVRLSLAVFWFNPLSWIVFRRLKLEQEHACDELVLTAGIKPSTYAATLLYFKNAAGCRQNLSPAVLGLIGNSSFQKRLAAILGRKLTLTEVTMKTRIILATSIILAVSLIGMARPPMSLSEESSNVIISLPSAPQTHFTPVLESGKIVAGSDQEKKIEAKKEPDKKQAEQKRKIVVMDKTGKKVPIDVIVVVDDTARKINVGNPLTIKKGANGELVLLGPDRKEIELPAGKPLHLSIDGKDLILDKEGDEIRINRGAIRLTYDKSQAVDMKARVEPRIAPKQGGAGTVKNIRVLVDRGAVDAKTLRAIVKRELVPDAEGKYRISVSTLPREKIKQAVAAEVKQAVKKSAVETAKLVARRRNLSIGQRPMTVTLFTPDKAIEAGSEIWIMKDPTRDFVAIRAKGGANASIMFEIGPGGNSRETYDRIVARVKQDLPEGYAIGPEFNEKSGAVTIKITAPENRTVSSELIKKLADGIKDEIK